MIPTEWVKCFIQELAKFSPKTTTRTTCAKLEPSNVKLIRKEKSRKTNNLTTGKWKDFKALNPKSIIQWNLENRMLVMNISNRLCKCLENQCLEDSWQKLNKWRWKCNRHRTENQLLEITAHLKTTPMNKVMIWWVTMSK